MNIARHAYFNPATPADMRNAFERFFNHDDADSSSVVTSQWSPAVDIREEPQRFVILADIPGVDPKEIEIHMDKGILTIKGERSADANAEGVTTSRAERSVGSFHRRFALPDSADADNISASGHNGVLEITIPKKPQSTPRRISVNG